ncbi:MAG: helix-turn-helix transcriptional regulator [Bacteroidota bacterium]
MFFSENLKYLRKHQKYHLSQESLAKDLGLSRAALMSYESGRSEPKLEVLNKIASYFGISLEQLINSSLEEEFNNIKKTIERSEGQIRFSQKVWIVLSSEIIGIK